MIGALTALLAALIAFAQDDIKKVLAYSTVSQLGFMFIGVGMGVFWAAVLHLVTHAFFKACLFLGAGSVMHGNADETDIKKLGGLRKEMPLDLGDLRASPRWPSPASSRSRASSPRTPSSTALHEHRARRRPAGCPRRLLDLGLFGALCTAFYMTRLYVLTFEGKRAADARVPHAHESGCRDDARRWWCSRSSRCAGVVWGLPERIPGPGGEHGRR